MRYKINAVVVLALGLALFGAPTAVSKGGTGPVYPPGRVSKQLPIEAPQTIGPTCPPGTSCVKYFPSTLLKDGGGPVYPPGKP